MRRANWYEIRNDVSCQRIRDLARIWLTDDRGVSRIWVTRERANERKKKSEDIFRCIPMRRDVTSRWRETFAEFRIRWRSKGHARSTRRVMVHVFSLARRNDDSDVAARSSMNLEDRCLDLAVLVGQGWSRKTVSSPQARTPLAAAVVVGAGHGATGMMPRGLPTRRGLQTLALVIATAYATILLYQAVAPRQVIRAIVIGVVNLSRAHWRFYFAYVYFAQTFRCLSTSNEDMAN